MKQTDSEKVPLGQKIAYATGSIAQNFLGNAVVQLAMPIYNIGYGVSASLIGLALGVPRIFDAITDPVMGHISDNTRSRWGRRRPYILFGGIGSGLTFALLWNPGDGWGKAALFGFFFAASMIYYVFVTIWGIPYGALGYELSYDYKERTNIQAYRAFFGCVFGLGMPWLYKMCFWSWDKLTEAGAGPLLDRISAMTRKSVVPGAEVNGAGVVGIIFGAIILITAIVPALCRERVESQSQEKMNFLAALKSTLKNKPYLILTVAGFIAFFGLFLVAPLALYINIYYVFGGDREAAATMSGWAGSFYTLVGITSIPVVTMLAHKVSKKVAMMLGLGFTGFGYVLMWWLLTPMNPWLQLICFAFIGPAWNCCMVVLPSMIADVCDFDELSTGLRREGMYGAINSWVMKMGIGAVTCATGAVVALSGVDPDAAVQTASTVFRLRIMFVSLPATFLAVALVVMAFYPITERRAREVRTILDARKDQASKEPEPAASTYSAGGDQGENT